MAALHLRLILICQIFFACTHFSACFIIQSAWSRADCRSPSQLSAFFVKAQTCQHIRGTSLVSPAGRRHFIRNSSDSRREMVMSASGTAADVTWTRPAPRGSKDIVFGGRCIPMAELCRSRVRSPNRAVLIFNSQGGDVDTSSTKARSWL